MPHFKDRSETWWGGQTCLLDKGIVDSLELAVHERSRVLKFSVSSLPLREVHRPHPPGDRPAGHVDDLAAGSVLGGQLVTDVRQHVGAHRPVCGATEEAVQPSTGESTREEAAGQASTQGSVEDEGQAQHAGHEAGACPRLTPQPCVDACARWP